MLNYVLFCDVLLPFVLLWATVLHFYCVVLYCVVLYCTVLYCICIELCFSCAVVYSIFA